MPTRLALYNEALALCEERALASLTENREPRRLLDQVWDDNGIRRCLEQGLWNFATRARAVSYSPSIEPPFGYTRAFDKPTDWVRTVAIATDPYFRSPLLAVVDEAGFWFSDLDTMYVRYVSDDAAYGLDLSLWPDTFTQYVAAYFAVKVNPRLSGKKDQDDLEKKCRRLLLDAKSKDAQGDPTAFPPSGTWSAARAGRTHRDRGNRGRLIG